MIHDDADDNDYMKLYQCLVNIYVVKIFWLSFGNNKCRKENRKNIYIIKEKKQKEILYNK